VPPCGVFTGEQSDLAVSRHPTELLIVVLIIFQFAAILSPIHDKKRIFKKNAKVYSSFS
jgi:hypothetical protein